MHNHLMHKVKEKEFYPIFSTNYISEYFKIRYWKSAPKMFNKEYERENCTNLTMSGI